MRLYDKFDDVSKLKEIHNIYKINENGFSLYQDIKFLLKKSVKLQSNFIIHPNTFNFYKSTLERLSDIDKSSLVKENKNFKNAIEDLIKFDNGKYLKIISIRLELYELVQNCLKDNVFDEIEFDGETLMKPDFEDEENIRLNKEKHKNLISEYKKYVKNNAVIYKDLTDIKGTKLLFNIKDLDIGKEYKNKLEDILNNNPFYKSSTSKKFINHIVALVQQLVYKQETKSIKLNEYLKFTERDYQCHKNGTYFHLLRLLNLENTEVINEYSKSLIEKIKRKSSNHLPKSNTAIKNIVSGSNKFDVLKNFKSKEIQPAYYNKSLLEFLSLKTYLNSFSKDNDDDTKIQEIVAEILRKIKTIINGNEKKNELVDNVLLSINYKNRNNYCSNDIYTFSLNKKNLEQNKQLIEEEEKKDETNNIISTASISTLMGTGGFKSFNEHIFSHFEIIKKENKLECRDIDETLKQKIEKSNQFIQLDNNKNILIIRLSDFSLKKRNQPFNTLGILTIYLNQNIRLDESLLRLLLSLRKDLTFFLKNKTSGTTFLELIELREQDRLIENSTHYLSKFHRSINKKIKKITDYENYVLKYNEIGLKDSIKTKTELELEILTELNCIFAQINSIDKDRLDDELYKTQTEIKKFIQLIFESNLENVRYKNVYYNINLKNIEEQIKIYYPVWYIIIPQLILNIKRYSYSSLNKVTVYTDGNFLVFENTININAVNQSKSNKKRKKQGIELCKKLINNLYNNDNPEFEIEEYIKFSQTNNNSYQVKLKII